MSGLIGATVVLTTTFAGGVCPASVTPIVVSLKSPFAAVVFELTVRTAVPVCPGARTRLVVSRADGLLNESAGVSLSLATATVNVLLLHVGVSVFLTFTLYSTVPPAVMAWTIGVTTSIGVFVVHTGTLSVVVTLFDVLFAWFALAAVTEEVFVPVE
jgi:hypothetical protein